MKIRWQYLSMLTVLILSGCGGENTTDSTLSTNGADVKKNIKSESCHTDTSEQTCPSEPSIQDECDGRGGEIFYFGYDNNDNGLLDDAEIDNSKNVIICNGYRGVQGEKGDTGATGAQGETGEQGERGLASLINSTDIPAGDICTSGGIKFEIGLDSDRDGILDDSEVAQTQIVCLPVLNNNENITKIHEIQGSGENSPLDGEVVTVEAIVTADFQDGDLRGFYIQEEDIDIDGNPETSEGVFVYDRDFLTQLEVGDKVRLTGTVTEFFGLTEIYNLQEVTVLSRVANLPTAATVQLPMASETDYEKYEGMRVTFPQKLFTTELYNLSKYGEVLLSSEDRLWQPTQIAAPGADANAVEESNRFNQIILEDLINGKYPDTIVHPGAGLSKTNVLRGGDSITNLTAIMGYGYSNYRILPVEEVHFNHENPRVAMPAVSGSFKVASINVLNYFKTIDDGSDSCGTHAQGCRGADSMEELSRQSEKMIAALKEMDADIVGLMEIQNDGGETLQYILDQLPGYDYVRNPGGEGSELGSDIITVAFLYKTDSVELVGSSKTIEDGAYQAAFDVDNRKPLAQTFTDKASGEVFTLINNHLKSKGSATGIVADEDQGDGQGKNNYTRTKAAEDLVLWSHDLKAIDEDIMIIGDLNAYAKEDPIVTLQNSGFVNLDGEGKQYSYVYYGQWGTLDYALANASLHEKVSDVKRWKINADESWVFDYNSDADDSNYGRPKPSSFLETLYESNAYRMSDHDPIIVGLNFSGLDETPEVPEFGGLFFSEYVEGSSNNKALEIFNATNESVDLSAYTIEIYANGKTVPNNPTIALAGNVASKEAFVIAHPSASGDIIADMTGALYYNGDDAVALLQNGVIIDVIGQIGVDPGSEWGSGDISMKDNTIRRKASIVSGDANGNDPFDPSVEWDGFAKDTFDGLGSR